MTILNCEKHVENKSAVLKSVGLNEKAVHPSHRFIDLKQVNLHVSKFPRLWNDALIVVLPNIGMNIKWDNTKCLAYSKFIINAINKTILFYCGELNLVAYYCQLIHAHESQLWESLSSFPFSEVLLVVW